MLVGDPIEWSYIVTNSGNVTATGIKVTDGKGVATRTAWAASSPGDLPRRIAVDRDEEAAGRAIRPR